MAMKVLFVGGTGNISTSVSRFAVERGIELYLLNRGQTQVESHHRGLVAANGASAVAGEVMQSQAGSLQVLL